MIVATRASKMNLSWYLIAPFVVLWKGRTLCARLIGREVNLRYKGSVLGVLWSLLNPLALLAVFTFVFGIVMQARWGSAGEQKNFSLVIYSGLVLFIFLADVVNRAPLLVLQNANYVKKVVFPLEMLSATSIGAALVNLLISLGVLFLGQLWITGSIPWTWALFPIVLVPFVIFNFGVVLFLSSLGVYLRDVAQLTGIAVTVLMYMSPILYPLSMVPLKFRALLNLNPLTIPVNQLRELTLYGHMPDWIGLLYYSAVAYVVLVFGFWWFWRTKNGFADVV